MNSHNGNFGQGVGVSVNNNENGKESEKCYPSLFFVACLSPLSVLLLVLGIMFCIFASKEFMLVTGDRILTPGEQFKIYGKEDEKFMLKYSPNAGVKVYGFEQGSLMISDEKRNIRIQKEGVLEKGYYIYKRIYLVYTSFVTAYMTTDSHDTRLIIIKGSNEMQKFRNNESYTSVYTGFGPTSSYTIDPTSSDDNDYYFIVLAESEATSYSLSISGTLATYNISCLDIQCDPGASTCILSGNETLVYYGAVVDYNVTQASPDVRVVVGLLSDVTGYIFVAAFYFVLCVIFVAASLCIIKLRNDWKRKVNALPQSTYGNSTESSSYKIPLVSKQEPTYTETSTDTGVPTYDTLYANTHMNTHEHTSTNSMYTDPQDFDPTFSYSSEIKT